ncbi:hypothetical protein BDY19DRAFT_891112 [Irpex rosettiformis]|uniref:Uncharacterized protein n=1 Tax=Irpex rosettiformis TaxID=378272 RepID=A0ACB8U2S0_9APHY|nr:hypothetical protein BDY19DRAFT_891112 [Irpex rosettiformis]
MSDSHGIFGGERPLLDHERDWAARCSYFECFGYTLRPRFRPGWKRSWDESGVPAPLCEDWIMALPNPNLIDATDKDGARVCIKRLYHKDNEKSIIRMLDPAASAPSTQNHSIPVIKCLEKPPKENQRPPGDDDHTAYLVMPFLFSINEVPFETVDQVADLVEQLLEGLVYMHARGVAHRDCSVRNIMMDATALYPKGFHPVRTSLLPDASGKAPRRSRSSAYIRYYYIDYGISSYFDPSVEQDRNVLGIDGIDREVPELSSTVPYDPFKVDVFLIGNLFKHEVYEKYKNLEFLKPLIQSMTAEDPAARPSASDAYEHWTRIRGQLSMVQRAWRLKSRSEGTSVGLFLDAFTTIRLAVVLPAKLATVLFHRSLRIKSATTSSSTSPPAPSDTPPLPESTKKTPTRSFKSLKDKLSRSTKLLPRKANAPMVAARD